MGLADDHPYLTGVSVIVLVAMATACDGAFKLSLRAQ